MTNEEIKQAFSDIYNTFWNAWKNSPTNTDIHADEWDACMHDAFPLLNKYALMGEDGKVFGELVGGLIGIMERRAKACSVYQ